MGHSHHEHNHSVKISSLNATYYIAIALNLGYVILETVMGLSSNSLGLLSDAGHKMLDVIALVVALIAFKLTKSKATPKYTYGFKKTSVLISLINTFVLLCAVCMIVVESVEKFGNPGEVDGAIISWTAGVGILVSGLSAYLLMRHQKRDINTRSAFLHMATDSLLSLGIVFSGILISLTGWSVVDPIISIVVALLILYNTIKLLIESFRMSVDAVPEGVDYNEIRNYLEGLDAVLSVDELHIWPVSILETALTAHLEIESEAVPEEIVAHIHETMEDFGIKVVTIETKRI